MLDKDTIQFLKDYLKKKNQKVGVTCEDFLESKFDSLTVGNYFNYDKFRH